MSWRDVQVALLLAGAVGLAGCSSDDGGGGDGTLPGTYVGELVIQHDEQARSVFADAALVVVEGGSVDGSTLTTKSPTSTVGEEGTITGDLVIGTGAFVDADLTIAFPTLGTFELVGTISWSRETSQLGGSIETSQDGEVIGTTTFALSDE